MAEEARHCLTEVDNCFRLLLPFDFGPGLPAALPATAAAAPEEGARDLGPEDEAQPCCSKTLCARARPPAATVTGAPSQSAEDKDEDEDSDQEAFVRQHGLGSHKYTLDLELSSGSRPLLLGPVPCHCPLRLSLHQASLTAGPRDTSVSRAGSPKIG